MTEAGDPAIKALIEAARADFARSVGMRAHALEAMATSGAWTDARREAHKLRGSAGVYGFAELGAAAAALDDSIGSAADGAAIDPSALSLIGERLRELVAEAERVSRGAR
jgi:HPt (histidine-containing phosphotransfer) domain-containing protein